MDDTFVSLSSQGAAEVPVALRDAKWCETGKVMTILRYFCAIFTVFFFLGISAADTGVKRYGLIIGANNGGSGRVILKYALSDAASFKKVMNELGGMSEADMLLLYNPDTRNYLSAMNQLKQKVAKDAGKFRKREFFFYYSGHSDEQSILLGNEKISYANLKKDIVSLNVDVRIVILDSCSSGAFTRTKGGAMRSSFMVDTSYDMKGNAFMTSSSADEASQESDSIKGSFFTHYIVTGMRGAADVTQDKKITLNEVYQFAYNSTLSRTQKTTGGAQHPNYHIEMMGTGDVVMTDVNTTDTRLVVSDEVEGRIFIKDSSDRLIAEFPKSYGQPVVLGIESGKYTVIATDYNDRIRQAELTVPGNSEFVLQNRHFKSQRAEITTVRGSEPKSGSFPFDSEGLRESFNDVDVPETESLISWENVRFSGYGGSQTFGAALGSGTGVWTGGKGGVIVNDSWVFGGSGFGLITQGTKTISDSEQIPDDRQYTSIGFGGIMMEYYFFPKSLISYSLGCTIGSGGYSFGSKQLDDEESGDYSGAFFAMMPEVNAYVTVTRFFRMGAGLGFLYFNGINNDYFDDSSFNSLTVNFIFQFGWF